MIEKGERERDMGPDEAFERFLGVDPDELDNNKKLKKKPPEAGARNQRKVEVYSRRSCHGYPQINAQAV